MARVTAQVQSILTAGEDDDAGAAALQKEVDQAWKMVDSARQNEAALKDTVEQLRQEIASLSVMVEQGSGVAASHVCRAARCSRAGRGHHRAASDEEGTHG